MSTVVDSIVVEFIAKASGYVTELEEVTAGARANTAGNGMSVVSRRQVLGD